MNKQASPGLIGLKSTPLAACVAAVFALAAPAAMAAKVTVSNCDDHGTGSLRHAVNNANSGDVIDMTGLPNLAMPCSTISLNTGAIIITQSDLTLDGPGVDQLTITGKYKGTVEHDRIFTHNGYGGTLIINNLAVAEGLLTPSTDAAIGGCIYSVSNVVLSGTRVSVCTASTATMGNIDGALGGGVFTKGNLFLVRSTIEGNVAINGGSASALGGGAYVRGSFLSTFGAVSNNRVSGLDANYGGVAVRGGNVTIASSTISGNSAEGTTGGIGIGAPSPTGLSATITNSTISGNSAGAIGGMLSNIPTTLANTTVAFNTATYSFMGFAPGVVFGATNTGSFPVDLESSLISNNTYGASSFEYDFNTLGNASNTVTVTGAKNLIRVSNGNVPVGTISVSCPLLGPLRDNGGATLTHALLSHSPAIDAGNNIAALADDQRGSPYVRASGTAVDIGAYEVQQDDVVFNSDFDGCPDLAP